MKQSGIGVNEVSELYEEKKTSGIADFLYVLS